MAERIPRQNPRTAYRTMDGHGLLVVIDNRELHTLNPVGATVWNLCDGRGVDAIVEGVVAEFAVAPELARADVERFLASLENVGALHWSEA